MRRIVVDFDSMDMDEQSRVYIGRLGSPYEDQEPLRSLREGEVVMLDGGDLEVEATLEFDAAEHIWFGRPNWATSRDLPAEGERDNER